MHQSQKKRDVSKDRFYDEFEQVFFIIFLSTMWKFFLGDFIAKVRRENIFKLTIGNESLHQDSYDNGIRTVNFATLKNLFVKSTKFLHWNIRKDIWSLTNGKNDNQIAYWQIGDGIRADVIYDLSGKLLWYWSIFYSCRCYGKVDSRETSNTEVLWGKI